MRASEFLREFAPDGYQQYTLYVGSPRRHKIGTFASVEDALEEVQFLWNVDPSTGTDYWTITDLNDNVVWEHDPGEVYDRMRSGGKMQFRKPGDLTETDEQDLTDLKKSVENWNEMWFTAQDIETILNHPYSQQFRKPPSVDKVYRGLILKGRLLKAIPGKGNRKFVAYATSPQGADVFLTSLQMDGRHVILEKKFNPQDFLLDYTALYESLFPEATKNLYYESEEEVWMRATRYYTSAKEEEVIRDEMRR